MSFIQTSHHEPFGIADGEQADTAPRFYRVRSNEDFRQLQDWVHRMPGLQVYDTIEQQVQDWIQTRHPKRKLQPLEMVERLNAHWSSHRRSEYGVWVYYPWSQRLVHVLNEPEYRELRTNRNRNKITAEEQARLQEKSIGIVGLSVGNAVALTLTLEGVYGHLTIADYDRLDLSNMNRIRASVCDIGISKTTMTARQIYEIDPYAKLTLFSEGLHAENIASFLESGGGLDCVIDECDDIRMKIMIREQARARRIPVLMETSDRGMLDIERFDLEPNRPILHGLLGEATSHTIPTQLSSDEKLKYVLPILGVTEISARAGASMLEVEETLSTWPQLASDVTMGGAIVTSVVRQLGLGESLPSGRRYVDADRMIHAPVSTAEQSEVRPTRFTPTPTPRITEAFVPPHIERLFTSAAMAPSGGNSQPWRFSYANDAAWLWLDRDRSVNPMDPQLRAAYTGVGAALWNLRLAAGEANLPIHVEHFPLDAPETSSRFTAVARIDILNTMQHTTSSLPRTASHIDHALFLLLDQRVTNRRSAVKADLPDSDERFLQSLAADYQAELQLLTEGASISKLGSIIGTIDRLRFVVPELHQSLISELRWTRDEAQRLKDGIELDSLDLTAVQRVVLDMIRRPEVVRLVREQKGGSRLRQLSADSLRDCSAMGLLSVAGKSPSDFVRGGEAMQHLWLESVARGWTWYPMTSSIYFFDFIEQGMTASFTREERSEIEAARQTFATLYAPREDHSNLLLFRMAKAEPTSVRSLRLPLASLYL